VKETIGSILYRLTGEGYTLAIQERSSKIHLRVVRSGVVFEVDRETLLEALQEAFERTRPVKKKKRRKKCRRTRRGS
jgi:hypothetical protein